MKTSALHRQPVSCAICTRPLTEVTRREPLGKDDAMVPVCNECATATIKPKVHVPTRAARHEPTTPRAAQIREHRDSLVARGLCSNGEKHGPIAHGRLCEKCATRYGGRKRR